VFLPPSMQVMTPIQTVLFVETYAARTAAQGHFPPRGVTELRKQAVWI